MLTGVKPADDQVAKFAASAPVTNVTGYPFIFWTWTHHSPFWGGAVSSTVAGVLPRPKSFGTPRVLIGRNGHLSLVDEGDWKTCAPLGSSGRRVFCGQKRPRRCLMGEEGGRLAEAEAQELNGTVGIGRAVRRRHYPRCNGRPLANVAMTEGTSGHNSEICRAVLSASLDDVVGGNALLATIFDNPPTQPQPDAGIGHRRHAAE